MKPKKSNQIKKELMLLTLANAFLSIALDIKSYKDLEIKKTDNETTKKLKWLIKDLSTKVKLFQKRLNPILEEANNIVHRLEDELKKQSKKRFGIKTTFTKNNDFEISAELFSVALILEHYEMKNKILQIKHKLALELYQIYENRLNETHYKNALALASKYAEIVKRS